MTKKITINSCPCCGRPPTCYSVGPSFYSNLGLECKYCKIKSPPRNMFWLSAQEWNNENFEFGQLEFDFDALSEVPVLEADLVHFNEEN